jgi:hypothetical protein
MYFRNIGIGMGSTSARIGGMLQSALKEINQCKKV